MDEAIPVIASEFERFMAALGPFEKKPKLAVGVSGGAHSMALVQLVAQWVSVRGGSVLALVVDHLLQENSSENAAWVIGRLRKQSIEAHILSCINVDLSTRIEERARQERHDLLEAACVSRGILHLLLAHHRDDQAETVLLRLAAGSRIEGLAAMAAITYRPGCRVLRPLLNVPAIRLIATMEACQKNQVDISETRTNQANIKGLSWLSDPMNQDLRFARPRLRQAQSILAREGLSVQRLVRLSEEARQVRLQRQKMRSSLLGRYVKIDPLGFIMLDLTRLLEEDQQNWSTLLMAALRTVSGTLYGPRGLRLAALAEHLAELWPLNQFRGATLGHCLLRRWRFHHSKRAQLIISREPAAMTAPLPLSDTVSLWDRRFRWLGETGYGWFLGALPPSSWFELLQHYPDLARRLPSWVRPTLPALIYPGKNSIMENPEIAIMAIGYKKLLTSTVMKIPSGQVVWVPARPLSE